MKKILLTFVGLSALMSIHAQVVEVYKNGQLMQTYYNTPNSQYEVVFKSSGDQGKIDGHEYIEIAGRKWATMNVGATTVAGSPETAYGDYYTWGETDTYYNSLTETGIIFKSNATGTHIKGKKTGYNYPNYCGSTQFTEWKDYPAPTGVLGEDYDVPTKNGEVHGTCLQSMISRVCMKLAVEIVNCWMLPRPSRRVESIG